MTKSTWQKPTVTFWSTDELASVVKQNSALVDKVCERAELTPRETEITRGVVRGLTHAAMAEQFNIAEPTVKTHIVSVFRKLGAMSRAELMAKIFPT